MTLRLFREDIIAVLRGILEKYGFSDQKAMKVAQVFTDNSMEGVYSHGINRFERFVKYIKEGVVIPDQEPTVKSKFQGIEQWDGNRGPGILNAVSATQKAMELADTFGIGCVAMANTNHWMRGGTYGRMAAKEGYVFIGWTNTIANLPAWGAIDRRLGNNPLVMAVPGKKPVVIDMAMSQYSYGKLEITKLKEDKLPLPGGYDMAGNLTTDPGEILASGRPLPIGYWKGAGLSLLLDILATLLSDGMSTSALSKQKIESGVSQVYICISAQKLSNAASLDTLISQIIMDYKSSTPDHSTSNIIYPGERTEEMIKDHQEWGIPILKEVWDEITAL